MRRFLLFIALLVLAPVSFSQYATDLNIDIGDQSQFGVPASTDGQAANNPGFWNAAVDGAILNDFAGVATLSTISRSCTPFDILHDNFDTSRGYEQLMDDMHFLTADCTWTITNMKAGSYDVYVYSWIEFSGVITTITVAGGTQGAQPCGSDTWPGGHVPGKTYVRDSVIVAMDGDSISFDASATGPAGDGVINGVQIVETGPGSCGTTVIYCTSGTSASGCLAIISAAGVPSATAATGFFVQTGRIEGQKDGRFFFGTNGGQANSWGNGSSFNCVVPPVSRTPVQLGTGIPGGCNGQVTQDMNALWTAQPALNPGAGAVVNIQFWYRDPLNTSNQTTSLSNAVRFTVCP